MTHTLTPELASRFARAALGHVTREYPNKMDHVIERPADVIGPRAAHPIFFGSFDWHSCVHGHWLLARLYRRFPDLAEAPKIRALLDDQFTHAKVAGEFAYLQKPSARGFERPYGWGWALMLAGELARHDSVEGKIWAANLKPFADAFVDRFQTFLPISTYPVRVGVHSNTAFALLLALDYAGVVGDGALGTLLKDKARVWYGADEDCQAWEPSQDEFLSPALIEAACMRAVLPRDDFRNWFAKFLPDTAQRKPQTLFTPASVSDRSDGKIAHLDGLNLSRGWCWKLIAGALDQSDPARAAALRSAQIHIDAALENVTGDYMGEHWLASFALLALEA